MHADVVENNQVDGGEESVVAVYDWLQNQREATKKRKWEEKNEKKRKQKKEDRKKHRELMKEVRAHRRSKKNETNH